jgi:hypothetical protein
MNGIAVLVTIHFQFDWLVTDSTEFRNRFHGTPSGGDFPNTIRRENSGQGVFSPCPVSRHPPCLTVGSTALPSLFSNVRCRTVRFNVRNYNSEWELCQTTLPAHEV